MPIADDDFAKLSYYLHCITVCVPGLIKPSYTNYNNYEYFTTDDQARIYHLCNIFEPSLLDGSIFLYEHNPGAQDKIQGEYGNAFIDADPGEILKFKVVNALDIGINFHNNAITQIMVYKVAWMLCYYELPLKKINELLQQARANKPVENSFNSEQENSYVAPSDNNESYYSPEVNTTQTYLASPQSENSHQPQSLNIVLIQPQDNSNYQIDESRDSSCSSSGAYSLIFVLSLLFSILGFLLSYISKGVRKHSCSWFWGLIGIIINAYIQYHYKTYSAFY